MYPNEVYKMLKQSNPKSFRIARNLYGAVLRKHMLLVRGYVWRTPSDRMRQFAEVEVVCLSNRLGLQDPEHVLLALKFRVESDLQRNTVGLAGTALFVDGPTWDGVPIQEGDVIVQLATYVDEWSRFKPEWIESEDAFAGCYVLSKDVRTKVPANHPLMFPFISMCFGAFRGSYTEHLDMVLRTASTGPNADARKEALMSFSERFGSFFSQEQRESARGYFGSFFPVPK